jgi:hypothetical protein
MIREVVTLNAIVSGQKTFRRWDDNNRSDSIDAGNVLISSVTELTASQEELISDSGRSSDFRGTRRSCTPQQSRYQ